MEDDSLTFALSTPSTNYPSRRKSHFEEEVFIDFEEVNGEDELMTVYPCPYCTEDLDLLELCCHIDLDHPIESNSGICPVCATWVVTNMVDHITAQHGDIFKISFLICLIIMHFLFIIKTFNLLLGCLVLPKSFTILLAVFFLY
ncbi:putative drought induced 19 type, zinc-binding protein [Lupinus albus]|uniref:Putative drought induced 19 type, zinc-binding protein n=1 Tax=Lupinus albus TaxID=3870 RepID=A0A6A4P8H9_LUPAL|nr:putative drought induced 19 type, zinc-binding protein [Lupinus albus]